jgi:hypothetical protein
MQPHHQALVGLLVMGIPLGVSQTPFTENDIGFTEQLSAPLWVLHNMALLLVG